MTRKRGRGNRRFATQTRSGLGTQIVYRNTRNNPAPTELKGMSSTLVAGAPDPTPVSNVIKHHHRLQLSGSLASTAPINKTAVFAALPGGSAAWTYVRIIKVDIWAGDQHGLSFKWDVQLADEMQFSDWGTPGNRRAQLHIMPNFRLRQAWLDSTAGVLFTLAHLGQTGGETSNYIVNITVEAQTTQLASPQFINHGPEGTVDHE